MLIPQVLLKTVFDEVRLTLVAPEWPRAPWSHLFRRVAELQLRVDGPVYIREDGNLRTAQRWAAVIAVSTAPITDNFVPCKDMCLQAVINVLHRHVLSLFFNV